MATILRATITILPAFLVLLHGCAVQTYTGSPLSSDQTARLRGRITYYLVFDTHVELLTLDDKPLQPTTLVGEPSPAPLAYPPFQYAEMLPGNHTVEARWCRRVCGGYGCSESCKAAARASFSAQPGRVYVVDGTSDGTIWVIGEQTGTVTR